ncbi:MAG: hypothetical protein QM754_00950 [Tepidisphaeraceae bacterium]
MTRLPFAVVLAVAAVTVAEPPATQPTGQPPAGTVPQTRQQPTRREQLTREQADLPQRPPVAVAQFLNITLDDNALTAEIRQPLEGMYAVRFTDWPGFANVAEQRQSLGFSLTHSQLTDNDNVETLTQLLVSPGRVTLVRGTESPTRVRQVEFIQNRDVGEGVEPVQLNISDSPGEDGGVQVPPIHFGAATFADLCREQPAAVRMYLLPILRDIGAANVIRRSDPARAWQVLGALTPPDTSLNTKIDALLKRLGGDDFADRSKAEDEMLALGATGAAELRRRDLAKLNADARAVVENAIRQAETMPADKAEELARDVTFLIDSLRLDDARLSSAAAKQLLIVTGKPLDLPTTLPADEREKRIEAYAAQFKPTTQPTGRADQP